MLKNVFILFNLLFFICKISRFEMPACYSIWVFGNESEPFNIWNVEWKGWLQCHGYDEVPGPGADPVEIAGDPREDAGQARHAALSAVRYQTDQTHALLQGHTFFRRICYIFLHISRIKGIYKTFWEKLNFCTFQPPCPHPQAPEGRDKVPDPLIFGLPDPTCNNIYIKESTNSSLKWWFIKPIFIPTYLKYRYSFF